MSECRDSKIHIQYFMECNKSPCYKIIRNAIKKRNEYTQKRLTCFQINPDPVSGKTRITLVEPETHLQIYRSLDVKLNPPLRSHHLAVKHGIRSHSDTSYMDAFDSFFYRSLLVCSDVKNVIYKQSIYENRGRAELINNIYYHGVVNNSYVAALDRELNCNYRMYEIRRVGKYGSIFEGSIYFACTDTDHQEFQFYNVGADLWHSPEINILNFNESQLNGIIKFFLETVCRDAVINSYNAYIRRYSYRVFGTIASPMSPLNGCECFYVKDAPKCLTNTIIKGKSRYDSVWRLQDICGFFIVNFFYSDKSLIKAILPPRHFAKLEEDCKIFTHSWKY